MFEHMLRESKADERVVIYELATTQTPEGKDFWLYLAIKPTKYEAYKTMQEAGNPSGKSIVFSDYGTVLLTGWGREPSDEVKNFMEEQFGVIHTFEEDVHTRLQKIRLELAEDTGNN